MFDNKTLSSWLNYAIRFKSQFQNHDFQKLVPRILDVELAVVVILLIETDRGGIKD